MEFTVKSAAEYARKGKLEVWIHSYLAQREWANPGLSNGLKEQEYWWIGPVELPLDILVRKCGPEPEMEYIMPMEEWERRVTAIANSLSVPELLPPVIAQFVQGKLILCDGNHRHEGARRIGWQKLWALIFFDTELAYREYLSGVEE